VLDENRGAVENASQAIALILATGGLRKSVSFNDNH